MLSIINTTAIISLQSLSAVSVLSAFGKSVGTIPLVGFTTLIFVSKASSSPSLSASKLDGTVSAIPLLFMSHPSRTSSRISLSEFVSI